MAENPGMGIPVEVDDEGLSTNVEVEREVAVGRIREPFDPAQIDVIPRTVNVNLLLSRLRRGVLDISPEFQRNSGIWTVEAQSRLIESLLLRIPLPTFYAAEAGDENWIVVDGIQRLSVITRFVAPELIDRTPLRLRGLEYLEPYEGLTYNELPRALQTRIDETEILVYLIRSSTPEPVIFNIFARLNTGGSPLNRQELRHALIPGRARSLLRELAGGEAFTRATGGTISPRRMADREMALRFLAFRLTDPSDYRDGDLDSFLRSAMHRINELPQQRISDLKRDFVRAMDAAWSILGDSAFRRGYTTNRGPVNKALFEAESVALAGLDDYEIDTLRKREDLVRAKIFGLLESRAFLDSISRATGSVSSVRYRFVVVAEAFREVIRG